jgi:hypothetical protein
MAGLLGMGGFGGLNNKMPTGLLKGNLAALFNPASMRNQQIKQGLLNAGIAMMNPDPHAPPAGIGGVLGRAAAGGFQGAQQAKNDFYNDGMLNMQLMDMQRQEDERAQQQEKLAAFKSSPEYAALPDYARSYIDMYPAEGLKAWMDARMKSGGRNLQSVSKGAMLFDEDTNQWITPPAPGGGTMPADIDDLTKMTKAYESSPGVSRYREVQPMLSSMEKSLSDPSAISDLDFVYGVAKILDPGSVVREKEGQMVIESQSLPQSLLGQLNRLANGEQALLPEIRKDLYRLAHRRSGELRLQAEGESRYFTQTGKEYGIRPDQYRRLDPMPGSPADPLGLRSALNYGGR